MGTAQILSYSNNQILDETKIQNEITTITTIESTVTEATIRNTTIVVHLIKFIYSEKATNFCEISTVDLSYQCSIGQIYGGDFAKLCGLLRIYLL